MTPNCWKASQPAPVPLYASSTPCAFVKYFCLFFIDILQLFVFTIRCLQSSKSQTSISNDVSLISSQWVYLNLNLSRVLQISFFFLFYLYEFKVDQRNEKLFFVWQWNEDLSLFPLFNFKLLSSVLLTECYYHSVSGAVFSDLLQLSIDPDNLNTLFNLPRFVFFSLGIFNSISLLSGFVTERTTSISSN